MKAAAGPASFEPVSGERSRVSGPIDFSSVSALLSAGSAAIARGEAAVIDLTGVTQGDSSGLALLIEWLSVAKSAGRSLRYENVPTQINQLARLSEVEELLAGG